MVCKSCGNELRSNEKFCTVCGTYNDPDEELEENSYDTDIEEFQLKGKSKDKKKKDKKEKEKQKKIIEEAEELIEKEDIHQIEDPYVAAYIGEDYKWVAERPFNIYALLLSWMYFLYRKLYLIGITGLAITGVIIKLLPIIIVPYIVLSMVFSGLFFNKIYLHIVEKRVSKIQRNTEGLGAFEITSICKKKGGVNVFIPLLIFFVFLVIMLSNYINISWNPTSPNFWDENSNNQANCRSMGKRIYDSLDDYGVEGELVELGCEITNNQIKTYNIYLKLSQNGNTKYVYFQNNKDGYFEVKGNTDMIAELETLQSDYGLAENYREFLTTSKELSNKFSSLKDDAEYENKLINQDDDQKEKTHFIFTRDEILN